MPQLQNLNLIMAKYYSFTITALNSPGYIPNPGAIRYLEVYYNEINPANFAKYAHINILTDPIDVGTPGAQGIVWYLDIELPDSATSIIFKNGIVTKTFPLVSTPPTVGTLFLTFDIL